MSVKIFDSTSQAYAEPQSVPKRYDAESSAYVETTGNAYDPDAGAWEEKWSPILYLYNEGDECKDVTGGWRLASKNYTADSDRPKADFVPGYFWGTTSKNANNITIDVGTNVGGYLVIKSIMTASIVSQIKNYSKLCVECKYELSASQTHSFLSVCVKSANPDGANIYTNGLAAASTTDGQPFNGVLEIDISKVTQGGYIIAYIPFNPPAMAMTSKATIKKIWLE